jgi:hypothetical protein
MYAALRNAGMEELDLFFFEQSIHQRFRQYDNAMNEAKNPLYRATMTLSTNIFGETAEAATFAFVACAYSADTLLAIKNLFNDSKIVN